MISSKSPRKVEMVALATGKDAFSDYSHKFSPKKFTRPQLFACLVLKEFEKKDYRGVWQLPDRLLGPAGGDRTALPFLTTRPCKRPVEDCCELNRVRFLIAQDTVKRIRKRSRNIPYAAVDSSGFEAHHASRYFIWRTRVDKKSRKEPEKTHDLQALRETDGHCLLCHPRDCRRRRFGGARRRTLTSLTAWWRNCLTVGDGGSHGGRRGF